MTLDALIDSAVMLGNLRSDLRFLAGRKVSVGDDYYIFDDSPQIVDFLSFLDWVRRLPPNPR